MRKPIGGAMTLMVGLALGGCKPVVLDPLGDGGGGNGNGTTASGWESGATDTAIEISADYLDAPSRWNQPGFDFEYFPPRGSLAMFFSDNAQSCAKPLLPDLGSDPYVQLELAIPPELFHPGPIDLRDRRTSFYAYTLHANSSGYGSNGISLGGTLDILEISSNHFTVDLQTSGTRFGIPSLDGRHVVTACASTPAEPPPTAAVAIRGAKLPAHVVGGTIDPAALYVFAGTKISTCDNPVPALDCSGKFRTVFAIPADKIGKDALDLASLNATYVWSDDITCDPSVDRDHHDGELENGKVTITSIDDTQLSFRIFGSFTTHHFAADGTYAATICP